MTCSIYGRTLGSAAFCLVLERLFSKKVRRTTKGENKRRSAEDWIAFLHRTTALVKDEVQKLGYTPWMDMARRKKSRFAMKTANCTEDKWSKRLLNWKPFFRCNACRDVGHPLKRWEDPIVKLVGGDWTGAAEDEELWACLKLAYISSE